MLNDADIFRFRHVYVFVGLSSRYFYPHLFDGALILASFPIEI